MTPATWMRQFIRSHKDYKFDSVVTDAIAYDLLVACKEIGEGKRSAPELLGENIIKPILASDAYQKRCVAIFIYSFSYLKCSIYC